MGARQSKPQSYILQNPSLASTEIPIQDNKLHSSAEPAYSREDLDDIIQERVSHQLSLHQQRRVIHEQRSADQVRREAEDLIRRQKSITVPEPKEEYLRAQEAVLLCYKGNPSRPLDCWKEVQAFKDLEKKALQEFVAVAAH
eukprot:jgi/Hompol1/4878/HPOL_003984-RA